MRVVTVAYIPENAQRRESRLTRMIPNVIVLSGLGIWRSYVSLFYSKRKVVNGPAVLARFSRERG